MFILTVGEGELDFNHDTVYIAKNEYDATVYATRLVKKYPDYVVNKYKICGKFSGKVDVHITEYIVNEKGEVYPK